MQQHLQRLDGVAKAEVSLLDGRITVTPKERGVLDPQKMLKATYDSGVSVVELGMTARGIVQETGGALVFRPDETQSFLVSPESVDKLRPIAATQREVTVRARLYSIPPGQKAPKTPPKELKLDVLELVEGP